MLDKGRATERAETKAWVEFLTKNEPVERGWDRVVGVFHWFAKRIAPSPSDCLDILLLYGFSARQVAEIRRRKRRDFDGPTIAILVSFALGSISIFLVGKTTGLGTFWLVVNAVLMLVYVGTISTLIFLARHAVPRPAAQIIGYGTQAMRHLVFLRRCSELDVTVSACGLVHIAADRKEAKRQLRGFARSMGRLIAKMSCHKPGEPGYEQAARLGMWLYWVAEDIDDAARVHGAIRACGKLLVHVVGSKPWTLPDVPVLPPRPMFSRSHWENGCATALFVSSS